MFDTCPPCDLNLIFTLKKSTKESMHISNPFSQSLSFLPLPSNKNEFINELKKIHKKYNK